MSQLLGLIILPGCHVMLGLAVCSLSLRMCEQTCHLERFALIPALPFLTPRVPNLPICLSRHLHLPRLQRRRGTGAPARGPASPAFQILVVILTHLLLQEWISRALGSPSDSPFFLILPRFWSPSPINIFQSGISFWESGIWVLESLQSMREGCFLVACGY